MATSYNFFPDRDTIIKAALRRIRAYDPEDATTISPVQYNNASETLNFILSHWQALGLPIWCRKTASTALTASQAEYTMGSSGADITINQPLAIIQAWLRDSQGIDQPIEIIGQQEYYDLSAKASEGRPVKLYYNREYESGSNSGATAQSSLYLWPAPSTEAADDLELHFLYQRPLLDFNASTDVLDMPQEWFEPIRLGLAYKIAPEYGVPASEWDRLRQEAKDALELALSWDTEQVSIYFQPLRSH